MSTRQNKTSINEEQSLNTDDIFQVTALLYFKEALLAQEFENCQELIGVAKKLGATQEQINEVITSYLRGDKAGGQNGANQIKNRLLSLKGEK